MLIKRMHTQKKDVELTPFFVASLATNPYSTQGDSVLLICKVGAAEKTDGGTFPRIQALFLAHMALDIYRHYTSG